MAVDGVEQVLLSRLKLLERPDTGILANTEDVVYNLNCLIGYFNAIEHYGASNTVYQAEQIIKNYGNNTSVPGVSE